MTFEEYLQSKKISKEDFNKGDPVRWREFKALFEQVHPDSFTAQKLFLINQIRRKYPLSYEDEKNESQKKKMVKPKMKISPKRKPER